MKKFLIVVCALAVSLTCWAQSDNKAEILVLGTYHMGNPGHDVFNTKADDLLAAKRQQEITELVEVLKKFHPTKIAIESDVTSDRAPKQYADYVAGKYTLSRNEIDQIGYRLAKDLGHKTVYPVDVEGEFPLQRVMNYAKANGKEKEFEARMAGIGEHVKAQNDFLLSHTVLEMLEYMNSDKMASYGVSSYFDYIPYGEPYEYAGPDLIAAWYQRNIRIYHNIAQLIDSPNERILVIYGSGHLGWLRQDAENDSNVKLRKLSEFVATSK